MTRWSLFLQTPSSSYTTSWDSTRTCRQAYISRATGRDDGTYCCYVSGMKSPCGLLHLLALTAFVMLGGCSQQGIWEQRVDAAFASSACPDVQEAKFDDSYYSGPLIDTHFHIPHIPDSPARPLEPLDTISPRLGRNVHVSDIVCTLEHEGTARVFAFFPVWPEIDSQFPLEVASRTMHRYPDLFVPFLMPPGPDDVPPTADADTISQMLSDTPGLFQGYGEIGLYELGRRRKAGDYPPDAPLFLEIYPVAREHNLMVYLHPGNGHEHGLERALANFPEIDFIVHGEQIEPEIGDRMAKYPNVYFPVNDLYGDQYLLNTRESKQSFLSALGDYGPLLEKDLANWKELIEEHPDRFLWGTDRGDAVWTFDREVGRKLVDYGRAFIGRLDSSVQERFAYRNAEGLISSGAD